MEDISNKTINPNQSGQNLNKRASQPCMAKSLPQQLLKLVGFFNTQAQQSNTIAHALKTLTS